MHCEAPIGTDRSWNQLCVGPFSSGNDGQSYCQPLFMCLPPRLNCMQVPPFLFKDMDPAMKPFWFATVSLSKLRSSYFAWTVRTFSSPCWWLVLQLRMVLSRQWSVMLANLLTCSARTYTQTLGSPKHWCVLNPSRFQPAQPSAYWHTQDGEPNGGFITGNSEGVVSVTGLSQVSSGSAVETRKRRGSASCFIEPLAQLAPANLQALEGTWNICYFKWDFMVEFSSIVWPLRGHGCPWIAHAVSVCNLSEFERI